jgi:hypothetical protein
MGAAQIRADRGRMYEGAYNSMLCREKQENSRD